VALLTFVGGLLRIAEDEKNVTWPKWPRLGLCLVIEIDNLRFIERDATVGCHEIALMDNFPLARHSGATPKCRVLRGAQ
jgi:hypothetical protein